MKTKRKTSIFRKVLWFDSRLKFDIDFFDSLQPQRNVCVQHPYKSGLFYSEKCKRHIQYESGLELSFIKQIESDPDVLFYYEQPVRIGYWRGRKKGYYTPDFGVYLKSKEFVIVEIKNLPHMLENKVQMKTEALMEFCHKKGFGLLLTDGKNTFDKLLKTRLNRQLEKEVLSAVEHGVIRKRECNEILKRCNATQSELLKTILQHNLKFRAFPFKIENGNKNEIFRRVFIEKKKYQDLIYEKYTNLFCPDYS